MKVLAELAALLAQLREDRELDAEQLLRRDREIARELPPGAGGRQRVAHWLRRVGAATSEIIHANASRLRLLDAAFFLFGAVTAWGAGSVVLAYDGEHPVNVINAFAVLVVVQVALLPLFLIAALPRRSARGDWLRELLDLLNVAAVYRLLMRRLPADRAGLHGLIETDATGRVAKWLSLSWSQIFAVGFNAGALGVCLSLIVFSDLAFAWSTTLNVDAQDMQRLTDALSMPWASVWPAAVPSAELIESSQYFRLASDRSARLTDAQALTGWWPFLLASIACYGALPRLLTLALCRVRLRSSAGRSMLDLPGVPALLERLEQPAVSTGAAYSGDEAERVASLIRLNSAALPAFSSSRAVLLLWGDVGAGDDALRERFQAACGLEVAAIYRVGGGAASLAEEQLVLDRLAAAAGFELVVLVKAWEPPLLEVLDFLKALRARVAPERAIVVIPYELDDRELPVPAERLHLDTWHTRLVSLADPRTFVRPLRGD